MVNAADDATELFKKKEMERLAALEDRLIEFKGHFLKRADALTNEVVDAYTTDQEIELKPGSFDPTIGSWRS